MWEKVQDYIDSATDSGRTKCQIPKWDINSSDIEFLKDCGVKTSYDRAGYIHLDWSNK